MLDTLLKERINSLANKLLNKDFRIENIIITVDDNFIYVELLLKIGDEYINNAIRIKDMTSSPVYESESVYSNIRSRILNIIECEYAKQLVGVLNE